MSDSAKLSPAAVGISGGLSLLALLFYAITLATLSDLASSDPAGNAYAQAFGAIEVIILWLLLVILMIIAGVKGAMPDPAVIAAVVLVPASGFVTMVALELLSRPHQSPYLWPLIIPALVPPLMVAFCFWALLPALRATIPARFAAGFVWGAIALLCIAIVPMQQARNSFVEQKNQVREKIAADFASRPADSPLWDWVPFLSTADQTLVSEAFDRIRTLDRRQSDAEVMLERGDFPLGFIGRFDLMPTTSLCDKARALLRKQVEPLLLKTGDVKPYTTIAHPMSDAANAMEWLVGHDCSCDAESLAWETMAKAYQDGDWTIHRISQLRDPKELGRAMREYPERFDMLTPKAHLKAWLSFADRKEYHEQALAGARKLNHRTSDAIEMLTRKDEYLTYTVLENLPALDLEATPQLCDAALYRLHELFSKIYRPEADDPRPYRDLLGRIGRGDQFSALIWLASHGCDANAVLSEAETLISAYQPSPEGGLVLGRLERLHRKP